MTASEPNPNDALARVLALKRPALRKLLRLEVWCEKNKCTPLRVFAVRDGLLVQCRSDANVSHLQEQYPHTIKRPWSPRRAFFMNEGLDPTSRLQVVCDCAQTTPRLVDLRRLADLIPKDETTRSVNLSQVFCDV